jgi:hypothetical protein
MKLQAPEGTPSISFDGVEVFAVNGIIDVPEAHAARAVESFGFRHLVEDDFVQAAPVLPGSKDAADEDDISKLGRNGLFAALKKLGVAVAVPITNDALRALLATSRAEAPVVATPVEPVVAPVVIAPVVSVVDPVTPAEENE